MTNRISPLLALSLLLLAPLAGCKKKAADDAEKPTVTVQAEKPTMGTVTEVITADAVLAPIAEAAILPRITAPVTKFYVQRGARVKAGQLLATLENKDLAAAATDSAGSYEAARGAYSVAMGGTVPEEQTRARLEVAQARSTLDLDQAILKSRQQLLAQGAIPGRDVDTSQATVVQAQSAYDIAQQHYDAVLKTGTAGAASQANGQLASAKGKLLGAEAQLGYTSIRSPIAGVVTDRPLFAGETASSTTPLITVMDTSFLLAKLHLAQAQAQTLAAGNDATLTVPGLDAPVSAKVSLVSPALDPGSTTVEVWLKAANPGGRLKAGSAVHATIQGRTLHNAMLVPTQAIQRSADSGGTVVMVIQPDGTARKRNVTTGVESKEDTQILTGLQAGDLVITGNGYGLDDGTKVKIGPAEKKEDDAKSDAADTKSDSPEGGKP